MNYDDFDADQYVEFETSLASDFDDDFSTLYSSLENLVCSAKEKPSRTVTVTSEYVPSSVESSFELGEQYLTDFGNDLGNRNAEKMAFHPESFVCSTEKKPSRTVTVASEYVPSLGGSSIEPGEENLIDFGDEPANSNAGQTPLDYLERALSEFVQFQTDQQIFSASLSKEVERICSEDTKLDSPLNLARDLTYRITSAVTPTSHYGSPLSETLNALSNSEEYVSCLNRTGQDSLIGAMESLQIKSTRKLKRSREDFEDFERHSEIAIIVTPYEISEASDFRDKNCEEEEKAPQTETSLRSKSDVENELSANIAEIQITGRTYIIGEEIAKAGPSYEIPEALNFRDKNCEEEQNAVFTETSLRTKSDMKIVSSASIAEIQITGRTGIIGEEIAKAGPSYEIPKASNFRDKNCEEEQNAPQTETSLRSKSDMKNVSSANIAENQTNEKTRMIGEEIAKAILSYEIPSTSVFRDKNCEDDHNALPTETSLRSKWDIENLLFLANIAENQTTGRTYTIGEEDNSEIATTVQPHRIPEASDFRDKKAEAKQSALPTEAATKNASSANIAENRTTEKTVTISKEDKSEIPETIPPYGNLESSSSIEDIEEATSGLLPEVARADAPNALSAEKNKKRKNPRVLTSQVRRQSLKYRRSSGQFVSMAEAMLKFQKGTPKRFRSGIKKTQNRPAQPKIRTLQRVTCPVSPALRCKSRARPSKLPNREARELLEIEEFRRNRFRATKSPAPQKSAPPSEKSAASSSKDSKVLSAGESKVLPRRATPRRKTLVKSVVSTEEGPAFEEVEIFDFGVPIQRTKSPLTKPEAFGFEKRKKKILERSEEFGSATMEDEKRRTIHPRSASASSTVTSGSLEGAARKPIDLTFRERNELLLAKKRLTAGRAREEKQAWVFHARLAPPVKQVLVRGTSTENLGPAKAAPTSKQGPARGTSTENLGPAKAAPTLKQGPARGTSTKNLGPAKAAPTLKQIPARGTSPENFDPAKVAPMMQAGPGLITSTENFDPAKVAPMTKQLPEQTISTENFDLAKVAPMMQAGPGRTTSTQNFELAKVAPTKQLSARTTSTQNFDLAKIAPMTKQLPGQAISTENFDLAKVAPMTKQLPGRKASTQNLGLAENKQKARGLSPAERSRGLSPAGRSRGLSPAERSRGLSPVERPRGFSPSIADRENRDPNVSSMSNHCPKLKTPFSLYTEDRSKKRQEFDATIRRKEEVAEEQRREYEAYRLAQEKKEERELRRTMESRARPMPAFKQPKIAKSLKPLTDPQSPAWSRKKTKK